MANDHDRHIQFAESRKSFIPSRMLLCGTWSPGIPNVWTCANDPAWSNGSVPAVQSMSICVAHSALFPATDHSVKTRDHSEALAALLNTCGNSQRSIRRAGQLRIHTYIELGVQPYLFEQNAPSQDPSPTYRLQKA